MRRAEPERWAGKLLFVQLAHETQGEEGTHVLEVGSDLHVDLVPASVAFHLGHLDLGLTERTTSTVLRRQALRPTMSETVESLQIPM